MVGKGILSTILLNLTESLRHGKKSHKSRRSECNQYPFFADMQQALLHVGHVLLYQTVQTVTKLYGLE